MGPFLVYLILAFSITSDTKALSFFNGSIIGASEMDRFSTLLKTDHPLWEFYRNLGNFGNADKVEPT